MQDARVPVIVLHDDFVLGIAVDVGQDRERPGRKRLYAVSENRQLTPANQIILSHELRHAMQDQYMDLHHLLPDSVGDFDDRRLALMSLVEGDATLVMERFLARRLGVDGSGLDLGSLTLPPSMGLPDAPPVLRDQLILPYLSGRSFTAAVWKKGGWDAVRAAWARPPTTTEQILHPDKFLSGEAARPATAPALSHGGFSVLADGVLGEMLTRTLLGEGSDEAAAGWGGDQYRAWDVDGRTVLRWEGSVTHYEVAVHTRDQGFAGTNADETLILASRAAGGRRVIEMGGGDDHLWLYSMGSGRVTGGPGRRPPRGRPAPGRGHQR